jgi:hypothetical protein
MSAYAQAQLPKKAGYSCCWSKSNVKSWVPTSLYLALFPVASNVAVLSLFWMCDGITAWSATTFVIDGHNPSCRDISKLNGWMVNPELAQFKAWTEKDFDTARDWAIACRSLFNPNQTLAKRLAFLQSERTQAYQGRMQAFLDKAHADAAREEVAKQEALDRFQKAHQGQTSTGRLVRIVVVQPGRIDVPGPHLHTGDAVPANYLNTILFINEPCPLKIAPAAS